MICIKLTNYYPGWHKSPILNSRQERKNIKLHKVSEDYLKTLPFCIFNPPLLTPVFVIWQLLKEILPEWEESLFECYKDCFEFFSVHSMVFFETSLHTYVAILNLTVWLVLLQNWFPRLWKSLICELENNIEEVKWVILPGTEKPSVPAEAHTLKTMHISEEEGFIWNLVKR